MPFGARPDRPCLWPDAIVASCDAAIYRVANAAIDRIGRSASGCRIGKAKADLSFRVEAVP
jgi:hypothetical protein